MDSLMLPRTDRRGGRLATWLLAVLALFASGGIHAADTPSNEQWLPVKSALESHAPDALTQLQALVSMYPNWPSGYRELAKQLNARQQYPQALEVATHALALDANEVEAACAEVQALTALQRYAEVWRALDSFTGKDVGGWLHYYGAKAAVQANDLPRADRLLHEARDHAVNSAPLEFFFLESRMAWARNDLEGARVALEQATETNATAAVAWYELGRVELAEADAQNAQSPDLIEKAVGHFEKAQVGLAQDPNVLYGLGYARYAQAKIVLMSDENRGNELLHNAVAVLQQAVAIAPSFGLAHLVLGNVLVQLGSYGEAIPHLQLAQKLGVSDRASLFNLALAMEKTGDRAGAAAIIAANPAQTPGEQIQVALAAYHDRNFLLSAKLLESVLPQLSADPERRANVYRFLGHSLRQAQNMQSAAGAAQADPAAGLPAQSELLTAAAEAYRASGDLHDQVAQQCYLALQTERGGDTGLTASWQYLGWRSYISPAGWVALVGNYGPWLTGGKGVGGAWNRHPLQTSLWGAMTLLPLALFIGGFLRRGSPTPEYRPEARPRASAGAPSAETRRPHERPSPRPPARTTPAPGATASRSGTKPRPSAAGVRSAAKPSQISPQKSETEEMAAPPAVRAANAAKKAREEDALKPSPHSASGGALERKPPRE